MVAFLFIQIFKVIVNLFLLILLCMYVPQSKSHKDSSIINGYLLDIQEGKVDVVAKLSTLLFITFLVSSRFIFSTLNICSTKCKKGIANDFEAVFSHALSTLVYLQLNEKATLHYFILSIFINMASFELLAMYRNELRLNNIILVVSYTLLLLPLQVLQVIDSINTGWVITASSVTWLIVTLIYFLHITAISLSNKYGSYFTHETRERKGKAMTNASKEHMSSWILGIHMLSCDAVFVGMIVEWEGFIIATLVCSWLFTILLFKFIYNVTERQRNRDVETDNVRNIDRHIEAVHLMTKDLGSSDEIDIILHDSEI